MANNRIRPCLTEMPSEVLYLIFGQFCKHCSRGDTLYIPGYHWMWEEEYWKDKQDLRSLCLVSRAMSTPAQAILHHLCMNGFEEDYDNHRFRYTPIFRFLGSIIDTSQLLRSVKALSLGHTHQKNVHRVWQKSLELPEASGLRAFMDWGDGGIRPLQISKPNFVAKLIASFPSLTDLSMGERVGDSDDHVVPYFLEDIEHLPLRHIVLCTNDNGRGESCGLLKLMARVIELSKGLQTLRIDYCESTEIFRPPGEIPLVLPHLKLLHLTQAWLDEDELQQVIGACPALRELICHLSSSWSSYGYAGQQKTPLCRFSAIKALEPCRRTLRSLDFYLHGNSGGVDMRPACFANFSALQDLKIEWSDLCLSRGREELGDLLLPRDGGFVDDSQLLIQAMPESIRTLSVTGCKHEERPERLESALEGLAATKKRDGRFPNLVRVGCDVDALMDARNFNIRGNPKPHPAPETNGGHQFFAFDRQKRVRTALLAAGVQAVDYDLARRAGVGLREERGKHLRNVRPLTVPVDPMTHGLIPRDSDDSDDSDYWVSQDTSQRNNHATQQSNFELTPN
ncbi:hypothetical protein PG989_015617 [Apiospora arundinis]